jgi:putative ABC transport system permease protein
MRSLLHDLRLAARSLARSPGLTSAAILCFALGLGATCAVFSVVDAVLLRDARCADPDRVVVIQGREPERAQLPLTARPRSPAWRAPPRSAPTWWGQASLCA